METNKFKIYKRPYIIAIVPAIVLVFVITTTSYAYFVASVSGNSNNIEITTGSLEIEFSDGPQVSLTNAIPGDYLEKTFKVKNVVTGDTTYDVYMSELVNDFADKTELIYTLTSNDGGHNTVGEVQVPDVNTKIVSSQPLRAGETHNYTLKIEFKETNDNQDDNKGKTFSTIIRVNEVKNPMRNVTFNTLGGTLQNNIIQVEGGTAIGQLPAPTPQSNNEVFKGWYLENNYLTKIDSTYVVNSNVTLYARYAPLATDIYKNGVISDLIGSFTKLEGHGYQYVTTGASVTYNSNYVRLDSGYGETNNYGIGILSSNKVDVSLYDKLCTDATHSCSNCKNNSGFFQFGIGNKIGIKYTVTNNANYPDGYYLNSINYYDDIVDYRSNSGCLDITQYNDSYHIILHNYYNGYSDVTRVWLSNED